MFKYLYNDFFRENEQIAVMKSTIIGEEKLHTHDFIEIVYVSDGEGSENIDNVTYKVESGSLLFINYGQTHSFSAAAKMTYYNILLRPEAVSEKIINSDNAFEILTLTAFSELQGVDTACPLIKFSGEEKLKCENVIFELQREYVNKQCGSAAVMKGYLTVLLAYIFRKMSPSSNDYRVIPSEITEYIQSHYNEKLSLELLAKKCFYSPKYFSRMFKACYGVTMTEYIQRKRIAEGCRLLDETNLSIDEIRRIVGYDDDVRFYKYFKKICKITPTEYRKKRKN